MDRRPPQLERTGHIEVADVKANNNRVFGICCAQGHLDTAKFIHTTCKISAAEILACVVKTVRDEERPLLEALRDEKYWSETWSYWKGIVGNDKFDEDGVRLVRIWLRNEVNKVGS